MRPHWGGKPSVPTAIHNPQLSDASVAYPHLSVGYGDVSRPVKICLQLRAGFVPCTCACAHVHMEDVCARNAREMVPRMITHRHTSSGPDGVSSNPQLSDASVANPHTSLPHPTYVAKHIATFSITLPHPKGVFQHQPKLPNLLNPTTNTNSNGCFQANLPTTGQPPFYSYVSDAPPPFPRHHAIQCSLLLLAPYGPAEGETREVLCSKAPENSATKGKAFHLQ